MATPTYTPLATVTLAVSSSAVYFTEISQDYSDLVLVMEYSAVDAGIGCFMYLNGDSGANYNRVTMANDIYGGATSGTNTNSNGANLIQVSTSTGGMKTQYSLQFSDYSATDKHKTWLLRGNERDAQYTTANAGRWASTSAITSISISTATSGNYAAGSTFKLFGIHGEVV